MNGNVGKKTAVGMALTVGAADAVMVQTAPDPDPSNIVPAVTIGTMSTDIVLMGAVKIMSNVTKWTINKLVGFLRWPVAMQHGQLTLCGPFLVNSLGGCHVLVTNLFHVGRCVWRYCYARYE